MKFQEIRRIMTRNGIVYQLGSMLVAGRITKFDQDTVPGYMTLHEGDNILMDIRLDCIESIEYVTCAK